MILQSCYSRGFVEQAVFFKNFLRKSFLILELKKMSLPRHQKVQGLPFFTAKTKHILDWRELLDLVFEIESARPLTWKDVSWKPGMKILL